jgi:protein Xni
MKGLNVLLIDALNLIRRVHAAQGAKKDGENTDGAIDSCVHSLKRALNECRPTHAVCVFEGQGPSFRHEIYSGYKAGRQPMPEDLQKNLVRYKDAFSAAGVKSIKMEAVEADDIIASLALRVALHKGDVVILSTDKIFLQLLSHHIRVRDHFNKAFLDGAYVMKKFGVQPEQFVDLLSLAGDSTNTIPGIPGVGLKTAARLLEEHSTLEGVLEKAGKIPGKTGEALTSHAPDALLARQLIRLRDDIELGENLQSFRYHQ